MLRAISAIPAVFLTGCSLFGPPLPPAPSSAAAIEHESRPARLEQAFIDCVSAYARNGARAEGITPEQIIDSAMYACSAELDVYKTVAAERARVSPRLLGWIDRSKSYTEKAVEEATAEARRAALDAIIRARSAT